MVGGIAGSSSGSGGGTAGRPDNTYFRPGEQAAAELEKNKDKADKSGTGGDQGKGLDSFSGKAAGQGSFSGEGKPATVTKRVYPVADLAVPAGQEKPATQTPAPAGMRTIIIRSGDIAFEAESFDSAVATVTLLINKLPKAFVPTITSAKLPHCKI